jgi:hypothetical protein
VKLFGPDKSELMTIASIARDDNDLVIKGKVFGSMPLSARLTPEQARAAFKLVNWRLVLFILTLPFRGSIRH